MSIHQLFKRQPVNMQVAQKLESTTFPAPTRGLILSENESFMQPGAALICDNWKPTMKGVSLRGGCIRWCDLHAPTATAWVNSHAYAINDTAADPDGSVWKCLVAHSSPAGPTTFAAYRTANPTHWELVPIPALSDPVRVPVISAFEYVSGTIHKMFAGNATKLYDVTSGTASLVKSGQTSGNYVASQMANQGGDWLLVLNDAGDPPLRFNGTTWQSLATTTPANWAISTAYAINARVRDAVSGARYKCLVAHTSGTGTFDADRAAHPTYWTSDVAPDGPAWIIGPAGTPVENGNNLTYVCKYRNRYFFVEKNSMNAWYLLVDSVGGMLNLIPLSGAATKGGKLLFCLSWSIDAGDGIDDKIVFGTDQGELLIFTGGDPSSAANWRQEGRYEMSPPMGMNAHQAIGGDVLIATVDGIMPLSGAITKDRSELELAAITRNIKPMWRLEVNAKREYPWTMCKWDEYGGLFVTWPYGTSMNKLCAVANLATGAWCRFVGYDATCFIKMRGDMFFGTQGGIIMQADRTGYDDGLPYTAVLVGGWEVFSSPSQTITWRQARASFFSRASEPFQPQLSATTDYVITLPPQPNAGPDPGLLDLWDEGLWDAALWDATAPTPSVRNTMWVSIGMTGYSHAPVVQVTVAQNARPIVDLISIAATFERAGVNV